MTQSKFKEEIMRLLKTYGGNAVVMNYRKREMRGDFLVKQVLMEEYVTLLNPEDKRFCNRGFIKNLESLLKHRTPITRYIKD